MGRWIDRTLEYAKKIEKRYYRSAYRDLKNFAIGSSNNEPSNNPQKYPDKYYESLRLKLPENPRFLIFKPDEIGDAACALPALSELRKCYPTAHISLICQPKTSAIYQRVGLIDEIRTWLAKTLWRRFPLEGAGRVVRQLSHNTFDCAVFLRSYPMYFNQFLNLPATHLVHPRDPRLSSDSLWQPIIDLHTGTVSHQIIQLLQILSPLTAKTYSASSVSFPPLNFVDEDIEAVRSVFGGKLPLKYFVVHLFNDFETRRYPLAYWKVILERIAKRFSLPILIIGGPKDMKLDWKIEGLIQSQSELSLGASAYAISKASVFLGNESGPAHLAGAFGVPTAIFMSGHSDPRVWTPWGAGLVLKYDVSCSPCYLRSCLKENLKCLAMMTADHVWTKLLYYLEHQLDMPPLSLDS